MSASRHDRGTQLTRRKGLHGSTVETYTVARAGKRAWLVTWTIRLVLWTLGFTRIIRTKIVNADVVPREGAVILAANHTSMIDVFFILAALRREAIAMAMAELWKSPLTRWLVEVLGQIPLSEATRNLVSRRWKVHTAHWKMGRWSGSFPNRSA